MEKQLTSRQANCILFFVMISSKLMMLPSVISEFANQDAIWVFLFSFLIDFVFCIGVVYLISKLDETILHFLEQKIGKFLTVVIAILFAILFTLKSVDIIIQNYVLFDEKIYIELNKSLFFLMMLIVACYFSSRQLRSLGRTTEILLFLVCFSFILSLMISYSGVKVGNILPLFGTGTRNVFLQVFKKNFWFGDFIFMLAFVGNVKLEKNTTKRLLMTYIFCSIVVLLFVFMFICIFNQTASMHRICMLDICEIEPRLISEGRFNWLVDFTFPITSIYVLGFYGFCAVNCLQYVVKFKFLSDKTISVMLFVGLGVGLLVYLDYNWTKFFNLINIFAPYYCLFTQYLLVFVFICLGVFSKEKRFIGNEKKVSIKQKIGEKV